MYCWKLASHPRLVTGTVTLLKQQFETKKYATTVKLLKIMQKTPYSLHIFYITVPFVFFSINVLAGGGVYYIYRFTYGFQKN